MLVLTRRPSEKIRIGDNVVISIIRIQGDKVRIGIDAPVDCSVHREEVYRLIQARQAQDQDPEVHLNSDSQPEEGPLGPPGGSLEDLVHLVDSQAESLAVTT